MKARLVLLELQIVDVPERVNQGLLLTAGGKPLIPGQGFVCRMVFLLGLSVCGRVLEPLEKFAAIHA